MQGGKLAQGGRVFTYAIVSRRRCQQRSSSSDAVSNVFDQVRGSSSKRQACVRHERIYIRDCLNAGAANEEIEFLTPCQNEIKLSTY
jgi:hypothetical protein